MQNELMELLVLSTKKNIKFTYLKDLEKSNYIKLDENEIEVNISDYEDKKFINELQNMIQELKKITD